MDSLNHVTGQLVAQPRRSRKALYLRCGTWAALALALSGAVWQGIRLESNPTDCAVLALSELPGMLLLTDAWVLGVALLWRSERASLGQPLQVAAGLTVCHLAAWWWARYLASFGVFYRLQPVGEMNGVYVARWGIAGLLGGLGVASLAAAFLAGWLVWRAVASAQTGGAMPLDLPQPTLESDMPAGPECVYEAQLILHNLGYEVGGIDGKMKAETQEALRQFQASCGLDAAGEVTMLTMAELRNRWAAREEPLPGQSVKALLKHVAQQVGGRVLAWWRQNRAT